MNCCLQVQMTLTPQPRPLPPNMQQAAAAAGQPPPSSTTGGGNGSSSSSPGMLLPLLTGAADTQGRLAAVLGAMAGDLLGRVLLDRCVCVCGGVA